MMSKYLLASDFDGTLQRNGTVTLKDKAAIRAFQAAGNRFCLCTGRCPQDAIKEMERCGLAPDLLICASGAAGVTMDGQFIFRHALPDAAIVPLCKLSVDCDSDCIIAYPWDGSMLRVFYREPEKSTATIEAVLNSQHLLQMNTRFLGNPPAAKRYTERVGAEIKEMTAHANGVYIDSTVKGVDKGTGVAEAAKYFGIDLDCCYTIGDHGNDLAMLLPYHGYVVESGDSETIAKIGRTVPDLSTLIEQLTQ